MHSLQPAHRHRHSHTLTLTLTTLPAQHTLTHSHTQSCPRTLPPHPHNTHHPPDPAPLDHRPHNTHTHSNTACTHAYTPLSPRSPPWLFPPPGMACGGGRRCPACQLAAGHAHKNAHAHAHAHAQAHAAHATPTNTHTERHTQTHLRQLPRRCQEVHQPGVCRRPPENTTVGECLSAAMIGRTSRHQCVDTTVSCEDLSTTAQRVVGLAPCRMREEEGGGAEEAGWQTDREQGE